MDEKNDELRPEYDMTMFLKHGEVGKYADRVSEDSNIVLLDPDISEAFPNSDAVNEALRLVLKIMEIPRNANTSE